MLILIGGATASGKTSLSIQLAKALDAEILSADSRLFYRGMDIGTAKPTEAEREGIPHHFIDICEPCETYSAGQYEREALDFLSSYFQRKKVAIAVGGSGFFLQALMYGLDRFPEISEATKEKVALLFEKHGIEGYQNALKELDPKHFSKIDQQNRARLRRALEVSIEAGKPYSSFLTEKIAKRPFRCVPFVLEWPREVLYDRINRRVDKMVENGLEDEAKRLYPMRDCPALNTVGYSEWFKHVEGKWTREEAIGKIKQHTRNYAKRQGTWFRKHGDWVRVQGNDLAAVLDFLEKKRIIY